MTVRQATSSVFSFGTVLALAACGSSGSGRTTPGANPQFLMAACMRSHGVANFPDPTTGSGGGEGFSVAQTPGSSALSVDGVVFSGPTFQAAVKTCRFFGGGSGPPRLTEAQKKAFIAKARCIREHGVPSFPDPVFGPGGQGVGINLRPGLNGDSPAIRQAAKACASVGAGIPGTKT